MSLSSSDSDSLALFQHQLTPPAGKRQRGRPAGSKNKPKPNALPTTKPAAADESAKFVLIDVPQGADVIESIVELAQREQVSVTILNGSGAGASVTLQHAPRGSTTFTLHGPFSLVSFSGTFVYGGGDGDSPPPRMDFGVNLSNPEGQIFGGVVRGRVVAGEDVKLTVSTFKDPEVYKFRSENGEASY
uniref:DNA-binding protein ESCAROLA n=2 Tax=Cajanus cajan TaxID=3821 RepID=A0A151SLW7_CAJCA|nr:Putative DNA-binding protein ESCAROLA [Cajanus cajan]